VGSGLASCVAPFLGDRFMASIAALARLAGVVATGRRWARTWKLAVLASAVACTPTSLSKGRDAGADAAPVALATIHYLGRFDTRDPAGPRFAWPGTGLAATFEGTGIEVTLADTGANVLVVVVDGGAPTTVATSGPARTYTLASNLPPRPHTLMLTKRTEASWGVLQLLGLAPEGGALIPSPSPFARRIEYVGDSITCGYGDLGDSPACHFTADTEDETAAYGGLAAAALGAEPSVIAYSGKGMYRDYLSHTTDSMPVLFDRALPDDPTSAWGFTTPAPDVVVINLGSNDFAQGDPGPPFVQAYATFLEQLRRRYPQAHVICALPPTMSEPERAIAAGYLQGVVQRARAAGDARVSTLEIRVEGGAVFGFQPRLASDGWGCDHHPSVTTQRRMGIELASAIPRIVGW
jgi:lysophospholipase L1-like esterase